MDKRCCKEKSIDEQINQLAGEGNILEAQRLYFNKTNQEHKILEFQENYFLNINRTRGGLIRL